MCAKMWGEIILVYAFSLKFANLLPQNSGVVPEKSHDPSAINPRQETLILGNCKFALNRLCPDSEVTFFLYSKLHPENPEPIRIGSDSHVSNLSSTSLDSKLPTKVIIHGYNSDMYLSVLTEIRKEYLSTNNFNVIAVDWSSLAMGPCYPAAVWNTRHVGQCTAQLIERLREFGVIDLHVIGFSLGAHVTNFVANSVAPYKIPRITGLDPAMPGFVTVGLENKLDKSDAEFVDVLHTNAFVQGQVEESGHVDFYLNGGVVQPGCWAENRFFACNHHRAPLYFAESVNTPAGFWGWPCASYLNYLLGRCPPSEPQIIMGEHINKSSSGVYLVITDSVSPFAVGKYIGPAIEILVKSEQNRMEILRKFKKQVMEYVDEDSLIDLMYGESNGFMDDWFSFINRNLTDSMDLFF